MIENTTLRQRILDLPVGASFEVIYSPQRERTLRNYASVIKSLTGQKYAINKKRDVSIRVIRYE